MSLHFTKPEQISLKSHPEFTERWLQERIMEDTSILGLGELELVKAEKIQPRAGRLDLLLHDDDLNRRYEVELMLGATDPSHIMRCIEYWDIERRHYPAYDHVAVLVAEDITSRFLNVMSLLAGSIPLIAIQLTALKVDDKVLVHCVRVLDQTALRSDDEYEAGSSGITIITTDREYWEERVTAESMNQCDRVVQLVEQITGKAHTLRYRRRLLNVIEHEAVNSSVWIIPRKTLISVGGYVNNAETWVKRFDEQGLNATLKRGKKAVLVSLKATELDEQRELIHEFLSESTGVTETSKEIEA